MGKDIYSILNDANINLEDYEKENFNDIEKKKAKADFRKAISKKKLCKRNIMAAGIVLALTFTLFGANEGVRALTKVLFITGIDEISSFFGIAKNLDEYKTVVNKSVTDNGITVKINDVILDGSEMIVSYNIAIDKQSNVTMQSADAQGTIYINGQKVEQKEYTERSKVIDLYSVQNVATYNLGNMDLSGDSNIKITFSKIILGNREEKKGEWDFKFKVNGDKLKADTREISLNNKFTLDNGTEYTLEKYTQNSLSQKIYAHISDSKVNPKYTVDLIGIDNLGNKIMFHSSYSEKDSELFKIERNDWNNFNENSKILTLTPYAAELPEGGGKYELKQVGETFTIDLAKLK